jgi:hypothetical protein
MPSFRPADEVLPRAQAILERERARLRPLVDGALDLTGGSSMPGALTGGDIDLHLRVEPEAFPRAIETLRTIYDVVLPEIWTRTFATFVTREPSEAVGIAATAIDSEHDRRFRSTWARLRGDPAALAAYNALKVAHLDGDEASYRAAKAAFFDALLETTVD